jgi:hypothetical protein
VTPALPAGLSLSSGGLISGTPTQSSASNSSYTFKVTDSTGVSATQAFNIAVSAPPALGVSTTSLPGATVGSSYSGQLAATGGVAPYNWALVSGPTWLLVSSSGALSGTPTSASGSPVAVTVSVTDSETPKPVTAQSTSLTIAISIAPLQITTTSLPAGAINEAYSGTVSATGGVPSYTWSLIGAPSWLSVNSSTGALSGNPTAAGTTPSFTVQVQDTQNNIKQQSFTITVNAALAISTNSLPTATVSQEYSATLQASGGVTPYNWSLSGAPSWLSVDSSTGALSGTPPAAGTTPNFTAQVEDQDGATEQVTLSITVNAASACTGTVNDNLLPAGNYAFMMKGWSGSSTATSAAGSFVADGKGGLTGGLIDIADQAVAPGTLSNQRFAGSYCVGSDNLAILTITPSSGSTFSAATFAAAIDNVKDNGNLNGHIIGYDKSGKLISGLLRQQTTADFSTSSISGNYVFGLVGADQQGYRFAITGEFDSSAGSLNGAEADYDDAGSLGSGSTQFASNNFSVASSGRGTAAISFAGFVNPVNFVLYVVNSNELIMMALDSGETPPMIMTGRVFAQISNVSTATINGTSVLAMADVDNSSQPAVSETKAGILNATYSSSNPTFSLNLDDFDVNNKSEGLQSQTITGSYSVDSYGRMTVSNLQGCGSECQNSLVFYVFGVNDSFVVGTSQQGQFGQMTAQTGTSFSAASLSGNYLGGTEGPIIDGGAVKVAEASFSGTGLGGTSDKNELTSQSPQTTYPTTETLSYNYCPATAGATTASCGSSSNGRFLVTCPSGSSTCTAGSLQKIIYMISGTEWVIMDADSSDSHPEFGDFHQ